MKRIVSLLGIAALSLTACTDQPVESDPDPTTTVTQTVTADPSETLPSEDQIIDVIAEVLERPDAAEMPQGSAALEELTTLLRMAVPDSEDEEATPQCPELFETLPEVVGYGITEPVDETEDTQEFTALGALGFASPKEATELTEEMQDFVESCTEDGYELNMLTHHTDEAFEIRIAQDDDDVTSVVVVRNAHWVFMAASAPASEVGLGLTLVDQLDAMLR